VAAIWLYILVIADTPVTLRLQTIRLSPFQTNIIIAIGMVLLSIMLPSSFASLTHVSDVYAPCK
jgi:hypothetical protein